MAKETIESSNFNNYDTDEGPKANHMININYSPEQPEMTPVESVINQHRSPSNLSQLTILAKSKAIDLMRDFDFKDEDLRKLGNI